MECPRCLKIPELCVCDQIKVHTPRIQVLILQHPQEPDKDLGTARLAHLALQNSVIKIGLSWRNLSAAWGKTVASANWGVLYLGSGIKSDRPPAPGLTWVDKKGVPLPNQKEVQKQIEGIVVIDGTWSQAKALWWRNAWLLKLRRAVLHPTHKSLYGELRREPRRECVSTLETIADTLVSLGEDAKLGADLRSVFSELLKKQRARKKR